MAGEVQGSAHDRARIVRRYLSALDAQKPGRSNARTQESIAQRMHQIDIDLMSADPVVRLHLTQERIDLHAEHLRLQSSTHDFPELEKAFIRVARNYGERHDVTFSAWRQVGVDADVLAQAGIAASGRANRPATSEAKPAEVQQPAKYKPAAKKAEAKAEPKTEAKPEPKPEAKPEAKPKAEAPAPAVKKEQPAKKQPAAKKQQPAKKAPAAKKAAKPEQQQLPAEVRLLG